MSNLYGNGYIQGFLRLLSGARIVDTVNTQYLLALVETVSATLEKAVFIVPQNMTILTAQLTATTSITANDTNYWTFAMTNTTASKSLLLATDVNTTKATGGSGITANTLRSLSLTSTTADLTVAKGDLVTFTFTKTSSASNIVGGLLKLGYVEV